ncbi:hypothetical protein Q2T40_10170 [Winogradskyella maritima]|uniref:LTXXQ motif family protein n=1 Tax=Winogradskyella maritima TaxID=1517766 RepID=A0ABV8AKG4_9FLAO|nr:hypothetical protein [Winogradskyella maritima]
MKKILVLLLLIGFGTSVDAQMRRGGDPLRQSRIPQQPQEPTEEQKEEYARKMKERQEEYLANFITTLEADDFQKEIIKQNLNSYFEKKIAIYKLPFERSIQRQDAIKQLDDTHFKELETLISEKDMLKIKEMIKGDFNENEVKKKKKKKRRKKDDKG